MNITDKLNLSLLSEPYFKVILIMLAAFLVIGIVNRTLRKFLTTTALPLDAQILIRKGVVYGLFLAVFMYIIAELRLGEIFYPVIGASVLVGAALALAVKDILGDAVAGLFLLTDDHFNVGDEITTLGHRGEIIDVTLRKTRLKTSDGTIIVLPNGKIDSSGWVLNKQKTEGK
ncbi:MAG TPA: mechanosensitive ion channel domain-containing protein [Candidatus Bathyarchaeia archaeon]|nr:mechanosensitive ion channel domain-containing protein [Candidatus Bathyarchaeia archaeon]